MRASPAVRILGSLCLGIVGLGSLRCSGTDGETSCEELAHKAAEAMDNAGSSADRTCALDSDCTIQDFSADCLAGCGQPRAVASSAQAQLEGEWQSLEERYCAPLRGPRCATFIGSNIPSCGGPLEPLEPACVNGKCNLCRGDQCLLEDEMQICTRIAGELRDCQSLELRR